MSNQLWVITTTTSHKELLSIILALEQFRYYLVLQPFVLITDCMPIVALFKQNKLNSKLLRWKLLLSEYTFKIAHVAGKQNKVADFLSRLRNNETPETTEKFNFNPKTIDELISESQKQPSILKIFQITTRNRFKQQQLAEIPQLNDYLITERNNSIFNNNNYDHVFHLFHNEHCELRTKLEDKWKKQIKLNIPIEKYKPYSIDKYNSIIIIPRSIKTNDQIEIINLIIAQIFDVSSRECRTNSIEYRF